MLMSSSVHYVKRPGAVLEAGNIVAHLQLDDPSRVQQVNSIPLNTPLHFLGHQACPEQTCQ